MLWPVKMFSLKLS